MHDAPVGEWRARRGEHAGTSTGSSWHVGNRQGGYTHSDGHIGEDVRDRLTDDPSVDATHVDVTVQGGEVTLSDQVVRRAHARRAEDIARRISGVRQVTNRLRVGTAQGSGAGLGTTTTPPRA